MKIDDPQCDLIGHNESSARKNKKRDQTDYQETL